MNRIILIAVLCLSSGLVFGGEKWKCKDKFDGSSTLVVALVDESGTAGKIEVAGITHKTTYEVRGFDRRWDFEIDENGYAQYTFVISPNGDASYYDFSSTEVGVRVIASKRYDCRQSKR